MSLEQFQSLEQASKPVIASIQLKEMAAFVIGAGDRGQAGLQYDSAMRKMTNVSDRGEVDELPGHIAITAAALGSTVISHVELVKRGQGWVINLEEMGILAAHTKYLYEMQFDYSKAPGSAEKVATRLSQGLQFLESQEQSGDEVALSKLAFLVSTFSATRNPGLRTSIYRDLQNFTRV